MKEHTYDAIVIGSGIGGLTSAAILAKLHKKKVLVLEKHFVPGGQTHEFKRKGKYSWDVGLHYVGEMQRSWFFRWIFDYITDGKLKWNRLPEVYSRLFYRDFSFDIPGSKKKFKKALMEQFPLEKKALRHYFTDISRGKEWIYRNFAADFLPPLLGAPIRLLNKFFHKPAEMTASEYINSRFKSEKLKSILLSNWLATLLPPGESSFATYAVIASHYLGGAYYPEGGAKNISSTIIPVIKKYGGDLLVKREVSRIIVKKNKACGVAVRVSKKGTQTEEMYYAPLILSAVGIPETYNRLIPHNTPKVIKNEISSFPQGYSGMELFLGLKDSPESLGFKGENVFIFTDYDHDKMFKESAFILEKGANHCYLSFPSLKTSHSEGHTASAVIYLDYDRFEGWAKQKWLGREDDYYALKDKITEKILELIESKFPGFKDLVDYAELSSPLTMEHFTGRIRGTYNGMPGIPEKYKKEWISLKTPVENLYNTGSDINTVGIIGAMMAGVATVSYIDGPLGFPKIILGSKFG